MSINNKFKYDIDWQILRVNCTKKYSSTGGWNTLKGLSHNCQRLDRYLETEVLTNLRIWRVKKLLKNVLAGYHYSLNTQNIIFINDYLNKLPEVDSTVDYTQLDRSWWYLQKEKIYKKPYDSIVKVQKDLKRRKSNKDQEQFLDLLGVYLWIK